MSRIPKTTVIILLLAALVIISPSQGQNFPTCQSEKDRESLLMKIPPDARSRNKSVAHTYRAFKLNEATKWIHFLSQVAGVVRFISCETDGYHDKDNSKLFKYPGGYGFLYTNELSEMTTIFENVLSCPKAISKAFMCQLDVCGDREEVKHILMKFLENENSIGHVVVASSYANFIQLVLEIVTSNVQFKWRRFLHATEWIILSTDQSTQNLPIVRHKDLPDFMTVLLHTDISIDIHQKSRTQPIKTVFQIPLNMDFSKNRTVSDTSARFSTPTDQGKTQISNRQAVFSQLLRENAVTYLSTQKSVMADMTIPVVVVASSVFLKIEGNTSYDGFNIDLLNLLSEDLGFKTHIFPVTDSGSYSYFKPNGEILGLIGYLARREAGLGGNAMAISADRREVVDYIYPGIGSFTAYFMYRVKFGRNQLGNPFNELVDSKQGMIYILIGPSIALVVGLVVCLLSGALRTKDAIYGRASLRRLYNFPLYWVFQTTEHHPHHSGRILRACWGLFSVVMLAAYSAMLTSNATAPPEYPKLHSLDDLLNHQDFKIGIPAFYSNFIKSFREAPPGTTYAKLWQVMCQQNESDPKTFHENKAYHIRRVLQGNYVFLSVFPVALLPTLVEADYSDVRFVDITQFRAHWVLPQNAFYKSAIGRAIQSALETGKLDAFFLKWFPPEASLKRSKTKNNAEVHVNRLEILAFIFAAGVGSAFLCIAAESILRNSDRMRA